MFYKKRYEQVLKELNKKNQIIKNLNTHEKELKDLISDLKEYQNLHKKICENEANYLHAYFNTIVGMVSKERNTIVEGLNSKVKESVEAYNNFIDEKDV